MSTNGRSHWVCSNRACNRRLATVRGEHPKRRLSTTANATGVTFLQDGRVRVRCGGCGNLNVFEWREPAKQEAMAS